MVNPNIFREYDIRGIVGQDLTEQVAELIGKAFGTLMRRQGLKKMSVGHDVRLSSESLKNAIVRGLTSTGCDVIDIGLVPTPVFYFSIVHLSTEGGIMVTGSHNPIEYNGFKMNRGNGSVYGQEIQQLYQLIKAGDFESGVGKTQQAEILSAYFRMLKSKFNFEKKLKIVIDAGNGTAGLLAPQFFREMGMEVECLYCEPDGHFPNHLPDPTVMEYIQDLRRKVREWKADVGIGYDGDSDRIGAIDNTGRVVFADKLLTIFSRDLLSRQPGAKIIFDVKCSQSLPEEIEKYGGVPLMWKTGHALIKAKLKEEQALLAGEMSGHIFFAENYHGYDDAIFASAKLVEILSKSPKSFTELVDEIPSFYSTPEIRVECSEEEKFLIVKEISEHFRKQYRTIDVDGVRVLFGDGWGLLRASNTQPVLVLRFEAKTEERLHQIIDIFLDKLQHYHSVQINRKDFTIVKG
ncbi:phosphomannomutase [candidate division KSB1 bacterium]|nr:MAG: phosphomannomutase [candidate division KSB1 bacterium 4484_219]RKY79925.1 MAG: phosphomannomutase [candidate division KSB1 bacterium]RKY91694.1 MAG: phosphomannomutase [candidate division KSB1 bacterium]